MIYNYLTTNKINGKQYVGMHSTKDVDDGYLGSGKCLLQAIKKYGKENFIRRRLCICKTIKEAHINESYFIKKYNTISPSGYNLSPKGGLGFHGSFSEEIRQTMRENHADFSGVNHPKFGTHFSEESKQKMSISHKKENLSEETLKRMREAKKNWHPSEESNRKRRETQKGRKRPKEVGDKIRKSLLGKSHSEERKQKNRESQIKRMANYELRQKQRENSLKQWSDPEWKKNHIGENYRKQKVA
ncbi:MAG TPA: hypothetical protein VMX17_05305 [Candidatus Glassbacteria bacterium]|nr:hypothetical protein [Candidatus Glassbacteria bacterium]